MSIKNKKPSPYYKYDSQEMDKDYTIYNAEQLLNDDYFLASELHPDEESRIFWKELEKDASFARELQMARSFLNDIKKSENLVFLSSEDVKDVWEQIMSANNQFSNKRKKISMIRTGVAIAATILLLLTFSWYSFWREEPGVNYEAILHSAPQTGDSAGNVQLVLSENKTMSIDGKETTVEYQKEGGVSVNSEDVEVEPKDEEVQSFNQLIVPVGKRSSLLLADGTNIWVNSGSKVIYPAKFAGNKREIFVEGEIYLDVSHDEAKPFIIKTRQMEVQVLGTQFGVSAYENEPDQKVVLVHGKVNVAVNGQKKTVLSPNQMYLYDNGRKISSVKEVDVNDYVAWKDGYYQFDHEYLGVILNKLCKYYGVRISWDSKVSELVCSGKLDLRDDINDVFGILQKAAPIKIEKDDENIFIVKH